MSNLSITVEVTAGSEISATAMEACALANAVGITVRFELKGVKLSAWPCTNPTHLVAMYHAALKSRSNEPKTPAPMPESNEHILAAALATVQERNQQIETLLAQLDRITTSRDRLKQVVESLKADAAHAARSIDAIIAEQVN